MVSFRSWISQYILVVSFHDLREVMCSTPFISTDSTLGSSCHSPHRNSVHPVAVDPIGWVHIPIEHIAVVGTWVKPVAATDLVPEDLWNDASCAPSYHFKFRAWIALLGFIYSLVGLNHSWNCRSTEESDVEAVNVVPRSIRKSLSCYDCDHSILIRW